MFREEYSNAYTEVLAILKHISKEDYDKISENKLELFRINDNKEYNFVYNPEKTLNEQNICKRAKAIIGILFSDYWGTSEQKEKIITKQKNDRLILEEQKKLLYDVENIFKKKSYANEKVNKIIVHKENIFEKCINKIKSFFKLYKD